MMISDKIFRPLATTIICSLLLASGCAKTATLALKFTPQDSTTYKLTTEAHRRIKWEGPMPEKTAFTGGHTGNKIEWKFNRQIQRVDDRGNAVAEITIEELKYLSIVRDKTILDFDSSREKDKNSPLARLIGQTYTIEIAPTGKVTKVIDTKQAEAAVKGTSSASKAALTLLKPDAIKQCHGSLALPDAPKNKLRKDDDWSNIKTFSFDMMGSKSYDKIYTLKEIKDMGRHRIITVEMNAIPTSGAEGQLDPTGANPFSKMFDNTETYTGELILDLTAAKIEKHLETLRSEWIAIDPSPDKQSDKGPAALKMTATLLYHLEKID